MKDLRNLNIECFNCLHFEFRQICKYILLIILFLQGNSMGIGVLGAIGVLVLSLAMKEHEKEVELVITQSQKMEVNHAKEMRREQMFVGLKDVLKVILLPT